MSCALASVAFQGEAETPRRPSDSWITDQQWPR